METKIGNEIIAEALGYHRTNLGWAINGEVVDADELEFHSDWNDLMHVVEWCFEQEADYYLAKEIEDNLINGNKNKDRLHRVWVACIHFIQHYKD